MPTAEDFRQALAGFFYEAQRQKKKYADVNAGLLHRVLGGFPGTRHVMPICCSVLRTEMVEVAGDKILEEPRGGHGPGLTIRFVLPRPTKPSRLVL